MIKKYKTGIQFNIIEEIINTVRFKIKNKMMM